MDYQFNIQHMIRRFLQNNKLQGQVPSDLLQKANDNKLNLK